MYHGKVFRFEIPLQLCYSKVTIKQADNPVIVAVHQMLDVIGMYIWNLRLLSKFDKFCLFRQINAMLLGRKVYVYVCLNLI